MEQTPRSWPRTSTCTGRLAGRRMEASSPTPGANVGEYAPLLAVRPDGTAIELPDIKLNRDGERIRFLPNGKDLAFMQGQRRSQDFWLLDLATKQTRPLTHLNNPSTMRTFDVPPDGKQIVFDRL